MMSTKRYAGDFDPCTVVVEGCKYSNALERVKYLQAQIAARGKWAVDVRYALEEMAAQDSGKIGSLDKVDCMAVMAKTALNKMPPKG